MYKVLIVEDEMLVRTGIRASIDWEKFNMCVVNEASNGKIAWELYQQTLPDLVLTDIKMPFMDGIELIRNIRSTGNPAQIIILSCLEDFSLAQEAIRLGVSGYILKLTMTSEEMESVLLSVRKALDEEYLTKSQSVSPASLNDILESSLLGYLSYNLPVLEDCLSTLESHHVTIHSHDLAIALMDIDQYEHLQDLYNDRSGKLIQFSIQNIVNEILAKNQSGLVIHETPSRYLLLFHSPRETRVFAPIADVLEEILTIMKNYFNITPRFYLSTMEQDLTRLKNLYSQCLSLSEYGFFMEPGSVNYYSNTWKETLCQTILSKTGRAFSVLKDDAYSRNFVLEPLERLFTGNFTSQKVRDLFFDSFTAYLNNLRLNEEESYQQLRYFLQLLASASGYHDMLAKLLDCIVELKHHSSEQATYSREIVQALQYLQENYQNQILVNDVAVMVGLSPNYFSSVFKKELGISFSEYLNRYRIEKSMELLQNTSLKTYEIAYQCGFSDEGYYGKTFKKYTGKTPNEHKKSCLFLQQKI